MDEERHVDDAVPCRDIGQICDPQFVGLRRRQVAIHEIGRPGRRASISTTTS